MAVVTPELIEALTLGAAEVLPAGGLEARLKEATGRPLRVKLGFDPTKPDLHIGHAVVLWALRRFQDAGHQIVLIIGDFTARIGDPTGKQEARPPLSKAEVEENAKTYLAQLGKIIDLSKAEIRRNGEWLETMQMENVIKLLAQTTVAQMLARENFALRYERNDPIGLHEFLYPLLQGQDSVEIRADIELGGTDQKFNNLMGRHLQENADQSPQVVMLYPILEGIGSTEKMSKSLGNYIGISEAPKIMYDKVMGIADRQMADYYTLVSGLPPAEIKATLKAVEDGTMTPRDAKVKLAAAVVALYHGAEIADKVRAGQFGTDGLPEVQVETGLPLAQLIVKSGLAKSTSEVRERLKQGGVKVMKRDGDAIVLDRQASDPNEVLGLPVIVAVGRKMVHVVPESGGSCG